ncbi:leucine-rich repeat protein [Artemisia annua]|uniref:Leucine-rich repeat protein n=1 Tax=Artemisia annua TaxID=35608 RepID=A0A2U1L2S9_ARTAN|nr:leucine-rich repeat protein [Artemisia annua]
MNDFVKSQIPSQIASLKQLRSLDLSASGFSGQIPKEISHLIHMSSLDLSQNSLKLQSPNLEYLLQNFTRLEELHLSGVDISSSIPHFLANFSSLSSIKLQNCQLQGEFPSPMLHLPKLKHLNMAINRNLIGSLPEFQNNTILEHLDLRSTDFGGSIPESISNLNNLVFLALGESQFSGHIPGSLSNLTQLTDLSLRSNNLTGPIPSLARLSKLITLELSFNRFDEGRLHNLIGQPTNLEGLYLNSVNIYDEIPPSLANLTKLRVVAMAENFIYGRIPSSFTNLTQLTILDLGGNQLQGQISSAFSNLKSLQALYLDFNKFSGKVELQTFVGLDKLEEFSLNSNKISFVTTNNYTAGILPELKFLGLSSCNLAEFPGFLRYQKKLIGLFLYRNKIRGLIPEWVWNNSQETLQMIDLSYNFITGFHQQPRFLPWVHLEAFVIPHNKLRGQIPVPPPTTIYYDVSNNNLTGEIPPLICEVKSLQLLALSSNKMTGILPPCLGNLSNSLLVLDLKQNQFHGTMMNTFTQGNMLKWIDLSENRFMGQVPKSLTNCSNLQVLSLGDNSFKDVFPFWLGSLAELQVLILRSNNFYGVIQGPTIDSSYFSKLRIIDLSNNGFNGQLPENLFQIWNAMKSANAGESYAMTLFTDFDGLQKDYSYSMTLTNKGVKTDF